MSSITEEIAELKAEVVSLEARLEATKDDNEGKKLLALIDSNNLQISRLLRPQATPTGTSTIPILI